MSNKKIVAVALIVLVLLGTAVIIFFTAGNSSSSQIPLTKAARQEISLVVSTNGIIEPSDRSEIYAPLDGFVTSIHGKEGMEVRQSQLLMQLNSEPIRSALAEANAGLLAAKRQARIVSTGPAKEEIASVDAAMAESELQLEQVKKDLAAEESLYVKQATTRLAVENLQKQKDLLQIRIDGLKQKKQDLLARYSAEDKEWEQGRLSELTKEVESLKRQLSGESVLAPINGIVYSLSVKPGSYVTKGQLLAQLYRPGKIMLRAYVDEPDLGRIQKGQTVRVEWDGMPNKQWDGVVDKPAEQVVALNNRSVGHVFCSINGMPKELIPNLNVKVEIVTALKKDALVVSKSAVYRKDGITSVLLYNGTKAVAKPITMGMVTVDAIEILDGINTGDTVILNPSEYKENQ
jgi:HlyD family secretion protein